MTTGVVYGDTVERSVTMDADLSDYEMFLANLDTTDEENVNLATDASAFPFVLTDAGDGSSSKYLGSIAIGGRIKVKAGGTVAPGDKLTSNSASKAVKTTTDTNHYGLIALEIGATDDVIEALVSLGMVAG